MKRRRLPPMPTAFEVRRRQAHELLDAARTGTADVGEASISRALHATGDLPAYACHLRVAEPVHGRRSSARRWAVLASAVRCGAKDRR